MQKTTRISIHTKAPDKPAWGAPCNGCGVCCLSEPCPIGMILSARRQGACHALDWDELSGRYFCGALRSPQVVVSRALPGWLQWSVPVWVFLLGWRGARWIGAGVGCDCSLVVESDPPNLPQR